MDRWSWKYIDSRDEIAVEKMNPKRASPQYN